MSFCILCVNYKNMECTKKVKMIGIESFLKNCDFFIKRDENIDIRKLSNDDINHLVCLLSSVICDDCKLYDECTSLTVEYRKIFTKPINICFLLKNKLNNMKE